MASENNTPVKSSISVEKDSDKSVHKEISKNDFKGAPRDQYGNFESDPEKIMDAILKDATINKDNGKLNFTFPKWLTNGPYSKKTVDQFISIITNNMPNEFDSVINEEEFIETDPNKLHDLIIKDLKIDFKKNAENGNKEIVLQFPKWFTHGPYAEETVNMMIEKITASTTKVYEDQGLSYIGHWRS
jgi:hypothetical protein